MQRRPLILVWVAIGLAGGGRAASAGPAGRTQRIGVLFADQRDLGTQWDFFVSELARRGLVAGRSIDFDIRTASNGDRQQLARLAEDLVRNKPDLIVAAGGSATAMAAKSATRDVPIVFLGSGDPVALGLVASLARPGGNITGVSSQTFDGYAKGLEILVQLAGGRKRVVAMDPIGESAKTYFPRYVEVLTATARSLDATIRFVEYESVDAVGPLVKALVEQGMDAAFFGDGPGHDAATNRRIADIFIEHRIPTVGIASDGMLLGYRAPWEDRLRTAAEYVDRILKGAKPGTLPVPQPISVGLAINLKTAKAIGVTIPQSILLRADQVIR